MKALNLITLALVILGGLNWGLLGAWDFNLVGVLFGELTGLTRVIYMAVGLSALWQIVPLVGASRRGEIRAEADDSSGRGP